MTPPPDPVERAHAFLAAHLTGPVSLEALAAHAGMSRFHLLRRFRDRYGHPPHAYHLRLRTARARELLAAGAPIPEAAARCGFADASHLTRWFKRVYGITPGRFRNAAE